MSSSIIQDLIKEGVLPGYWDFRSGSFVDLSGNGNDGTPTDVAWTNDGVQVTTVAGRINVADSPELQGTEFALVMFGDMNRVVANDRFIQKRDGSGTNFDFFAVNPGRLGIVDSSNTLRNNFTDTSNKKCFAINIKNSEIPEGFTDGISVGAYDGVVTIAPANAALTISNYYTNIFGAYSPLKAALVISRKLTTTEHSLLFAELSNMSWPSIPTTLSNADLKVDVNDSSLVAGYNMKPEGGVIVDQSSSGHDLTTITSRYEKSLLGDAQVFDGAEYMTTADTPFASADFNTPGGCTVSMWLSLGSVTDCIFLDIQGRLSIRQLGSFLYAEVFDSTSVWQQAVSDVVVGLNVPYYVVGTFERNGAVKLYVNGVLQTTTDTMDNFNISVLARPLAIGSQYDLATPMTGKVNVTEILTGVKNQAWVTKEYNKGKTALWKTDFGATVSVADVSSGNLGGTPFEVSSGSFKVVTDTIEGNTVKVIECVTDGVCSVPTSYFHQTPTEAAYGEWEFFADPAGSIFFAFVSDISTYTTFYGYRIFIGATSGGQISIAQITGGGSTTKLYKAGSSFDSGYNRFKITRSPSGVFSLYINNILFGGLTFGTNPFTQNTFTESNYMVWDMDAGDKIALSSVKGDYSIIKKLV